MTTDIVQDPWLALRSFTPARIALGRVGASLPTKPMLEFGLDHARARDAVHQPLEAEKLIRQLEENGFETLRVHSAVADRSQYLKRPDLGRRLDQQSRAQLGSIHLAAPPEVSFMIADGLSAQAVATHALPLLLELRPLLQGWSMAPLVVAEQGRVALGDEVGELLGARLAVVLIGERPGLSSPDSLGIYLTYAPRVGRNDSERNCISNVRPQGLSYSEAAARLCHLMNASRQQSLSGVGLKDESWIVSELT